MLKDFDRDQQLHLGIKYVMDNLNVQNIYGGEKKRNIEWMSTGKKNSLLRQLDELRRWVSFQRSQPKRIETLKNILLHFKEIRGILRKLESANEFLSETELFELKNFAIDMEHLRAEFTLCSFDFGDIIPISTADTIKILNPEVQITRSFAICNAYSANLAVIRQEKNIIEKKIAGKLENLQPLMRKRNVIIEKERAEENIIKKELSGKLRVNLELFYLNIRFIAELDFLIAKASLALKFNCVAPEFRDNETIEIKENINPYVVSILEKEGKKFTPISLCLKSGANVLTGANMGGKTVALSTITLNIVLAHCGFFVFAKSLILPVLDYIYFIGHAGQSVQEGLSSFGSEVKEVTRLISAMQNKRGFCALDEFARSTNPDEGRLMGRALLSYAEKYQAFCLLSTHLNGVVMKGMSHFQVVGLKKANLEALSEAKNGESVQVLQELMDFNIESVEWDNLPPQDAIRVAELMGLQTEFLDLVRNYYKEQQ
ncbi:MAG: hypothetical protein JEZ06_16385 [Anaerolineaceae bacterium]|nr:hypothetical protein [Anaerolineaceae bacterium]